MPQPSYCRVCGAPIRWTLTKAHKRLAVDLEPDPSGNTAVSRNGLGTWLSRRPTEELPVAPHEKLHTPHAATCKRPEPKPTTRRLGVVNLADARRRRGGSR
jgi:hypothetical protein